MKGSLRSPDLEIVLALRRLGGETVKKKSGCPCLCHIPDGRIRVDEILKVQEVGCNDRN